MQCIQAKYVAVFTPDTCTMQQFMWQKGVAQFIMECFAMLYAPSDDDSIPCKQP